MPTALVWNTLAVNLLQSVTLLAFWNVFCPVKTPLKSQALVGAFLTLTTYCYHLVLNVLLFSDYSRFWDMMTGPAQSLIRRFNVSAFYPFEMMLFTLILFIGFRNMEAPTRLWTALYAYTTEQVLSLILGWLVPNQQAPLLTVTLPLLVLSVVAAILSRRFGFFRFVERHALTLRIICGAILLPFVLWMLMVLVVTLLDAVDLTGDFAVLLLPYLMALVGMVIIGATTWIVHKEQQRSKLRRTADRMEDRNRFIDENRQNVHDFNKHIRYLRNAVNMYCAQGDTDALVADVNRYCDELLERSEKDEILLHLDDPTLRAVLYGRRAQAAADNILFILDATPLLPHFPMKNYELVEMVDNLIDNAFEGALTVEDARFVRVILSCEEQPSGGYRHTLCIQNPCVSPDLDRLLSDKPFSTKGGVHQGVGLSKVNRLAASMGGKLILGFEDGVFSAKILYDEP